MSKGFSQIILLVALIVLALALSWIAPKQPTSVQVPATNTVSVSRATSTPETVQVSFSKNGDIVVVNAEVVRTEEEVTRGLGGRDSLAPGTGMWFAFSSNGRFGIWMKDMQFAIDIIWVDEDLRVVSIEEKISPDTYPEVFYPSRDARSVLEVPAGFVENSHLEVGNALSVH